MALCHDFYNVKTKSRVQHYLKRFETTDQPVIINDVPMPTVSEQLEAVDWKLICETIHWSGFHGDLHGENIIFNNGDFKLIDWRQNFAGSSYLFGDAYYDFAKVYHGLLVNHGIVSRGGFEVIERDKTNMVVSIDQKSNLVEAAQGLELWLMQNGFNVSKVKLLTGLIFSQHRRIA